VSGTAIDFASWTTAERHPSTAQCKHCGLPCLPENHFCCAGCAAAFEIIQGLGLDEYYRKRILDPEVRSLRPDLAERFDIAPYVETVDDGTRSISLAVEGIQCGACIWLIEQVLARDPRILRARVNMTTRRIRIVWRGNAGFAQDFVNTVERLGYRLMPFDASRLSAATNEAGRRLIRALAVAGFAAGNVMLLSIGIWAGLAQGMGAATRDLLHWVSALLALPAIAYSGYVFFRSAWQAVRHGRTNMDVPVSVGVLLVTAMSVAQTIAGGEHTYFDSALTLLFFLLIGRTLEQRVRGKMQDAATQLLALRHGDMTVVLADGSTSRRGHEAVAPGDLVLVGQGERIGIDGVIVKGVPRQHQWHRFEVVI
jgi:Cu2+-exporting ATPase